MPRHPGTKPFCVYDLRGESEAWSDWESWMPRYLYTNKSNDNSSESESKMEFDSFTAYPEWRNRKIAKKRAIIAAAWTIGLLLLSFIASIAL